MPGIVDAHPVVGIALDRGAIVVNCDEQAYRVGRLADYPRQADVLIVAAGSPGLITGDMVKDGVIAIDVGINAVPYATGQIHLVGDKELNAFSAGGLQLFINTGLIIESHTPNELTGVMAHETGHIAGGHIAHRAHCRQAASQAYGEEELGQAVDSS